MIKPTLYREDLIGHRARLETWVQNNAGQGLCAGSDVIIHDVVRGKGITIKRVCCPECGQYTVIRGVARKQLTLLEDPP